ncbi:MAG: Ig-like domain-containing protein, partial [Kiritimatiellia bacterium]
MTRHSIILILSGFLVFCGGLWAGDRADLLRIDDKISNTESLIEDYVRYREGIWRINPPAHEEPLNSIANTPGRGWFEKAWARWLTMPGWFVTHQRSPDTLSVDLQNSYWDRGQPESVQIWEHPGQEMIYIGRETPGKGDGIQIIARSPAPQWELRKGENVKEFYERELSTRRIVWTIRSPYAPEPEESPAPAFRTLMMLEPDELQLRWSAVDSTELEAEVEFGSALIGGPFTLWYLEGSLMDPFPSAWSVGFWQAERPSGSIWTFSLPLSGMTQNLLFARATLGVIDTDQDGMDDGWEIWNFGEPVNPNDDSDSDGLTNLEEYLHGTDPNNPDTSGNGIPDGWEVLKAGQFSIWPASVPIALFQNQSMSKTLILWNDTEATVEVDLTLSDHLGPTYGFQDSLEDGIAYTWNDISQSGTRMDHISDILDGFESIDLVNFSFPFYGNSFDRVYVGSNGFISFGNGSDIFTNEPLPSISAPSNLIAAFWDDLDTRTTGDIYYQEFSDHLIVQFDQVGRYSGAAEYTFQIVLRASGVIEFFYDDLQGITTSATVGIQGGEPLQGLQIAYNEAYLDNGMAVRIDPQSAFVTLSEVSGTLPPQSTTSIEATFTSGQLPFATYTATLTTDHTAAAPVQLIETSLILSVENTPSIVTLTQPEGPVTILESDILTLSATATDAEGVERVKFYAGETKIGERYSPAYTVAWQNPPPGEHFVFARGVDVYGATTDSTSVVVTVLADSDGDGMPDAWEIAHGLDPLVDDAGADLDGDGLTNIWEYTHGFDPSDPFDALRDTSENDIPDWWEITHFGAFGSVDASADPDGDGLSNLEEFPAGTDPHNWDTDGDLLPDGWEVEHGLDPLDSTGDNGADGDPDGDGLGNLQEMIHGTHPLIADTDGDGVNDGDEVGQGSNPNNAGDGGLPPPANELIEVPFSVGDPSGSYSERWK